MPIQVHCVVSYMMRQCCSQGRIVSFLSNKTYIFIERYRLLRINSKNKVVVCQFDYIYCVLSCGIALFS